MDQSTQRGARRPDSLAEELAREACVGMVFHLLSKGRSVVSDADWEAKRALLVADYARRSVDLPPELQSRLDRAVVSSFDADRGPMDLTTLHGTLPKEAKVDVAIITILQEELKATLRAFELDEKPQSEQPFYRKQLSCRGRPERPLDVVITSASKPLNVHIGVPVFRLRNKYPPRAVFLVGIAGGREGKVVQGDIAIATRVFYYEPGRMTSEGIAPRPQWAEAQNAYGNGLFSYDPRETQFRDRIGHFIASIPKHHRPATLRNDHTPEVHRANTTIAAGEIVYRDGTRLEEMAQQFDDTIRAVDQESYGFAEAVRDLPWAIFRGISDVADHVQDDRWKYTAAGFAAICLRDFLENYYVPPDIADF